LHLIVWSISIGTAIPVIITRKTITTTVIIWVTPLLFAYLISLILSILLVYKVYHQEKQDITLSVLSVSTKLVRLLVLYEAGFTFGWAFGFTLWVMYLSLGDCFRIPFVVAMIITIFWQLTGFYNSIIFIITQKQIRNQLLGVGIIRILLAPILVIPYIILTIRHALQKKREKQKVEEEYLINHD